MAKVWLRFPGDYTKDEKAHQVLLTEAGHDKAERILTQMGLLPEGASYTTSPHHLGAPFVRRIACSCFVF